MSDLVDLSNYPYTFNPPLHPSQNHHNPDLSISSADHAAWKESISRIYNEQGHTYNSDWGEYEGSANSFNNLRLGRIIQGKEALTAAMMDVGARYGFRFLYNPTSVSGGTNVGTDFIPNPASSRIPVVLQNGLETLRMELFLNRTPELMGGATVGEYQQAIKQEEMDQIKERGTNYDLEYLYRIANGSHNLKYRQQTGDIGILFPNPCILILGPFRTRGAILSISATTTVFSPSMVPAITYVQLDFARFLTTNVDDTETIKSGGVTVTGGEGGGADSGSGSSSGSASAPSGSGTNSSERKSDPTGGSFVTASCLDMYTKVMAAYGKEFKSVGCHRPRDSYDDHPGGHACDFMITSGGHPTDAQRAKGWEIANWVKANYASLSVSYVIWDRKIWSVKRNSEGWRFYSSSDNPSAAHTNHIHITASSLMK